ncbi:hypothetical protein, partial [Pelomonas sp. KK5]|uniref:beta strand repeat-containing protein n=1 Tax=Pelomonas sp. KK5 TaxID=1855730 RepID=UPI001301A09A
LAGGGARGQDPALANAEMLVLAPGASLRADATVQGDGGHLVLWSERGTGAYGSLSARGGPQGGNGGSAEVSSAGVLDFRTLVDLSAPRGQRGTLLLDPLTLTIGGIDSIDGLLGLLTGPLLNWDDFPLVNSLLSAATLQSQLGSANVLLEASQDITVSNAIGSTSGRSLTLSAGNNINVNASISVSGNLTLNANNTFTTGGGSPASGSGSLNFAGGVTLIGANIALGAAGSVALPNVVASGALSVTSLNGGISQAIGSTLTLGLDGSSFTTQAGGQAIALGQANTFNGRSVAFSTTGAGANVSVNADALVLGASTIGGNLSAITRTGSITQAAGASLTLGEDGSSFATGAPGQSIALTNSGNQFGAHSVAFQTLGAGGAVSVTADALKFATSSVGGALAATTTGGNITQTGPITTGANGSSFTASGVGHGILLDTQANNITGLVSGSITLSTQGDLALRNVGGIVIPASLSSVPGKLVLVSDTGSILQTSAFSVGADGSSFTTSGTNQPILLSQANLLNGHTVSLNTTGSGGSAVLNADVITLAASTIGGNLNATASIGGITQTGALTLGTDGSSFTTSSAGQPILLTQSNVFSGRSVLLNAGGDASITADALQFAASSVAGKLTATASAGGIVQSGVLALGADGSSFTTTGTGQVIVLNLANLLNGHSIGLFSGGDALLVADAVKLATSSVGGKLDITASTGGITQSGPLTLGADGSSFTTSGAGQAIVLDAANHFNGFTTAFFTTGGDVTVRAEALSIASSNLGHALAAFAY